MHPQDTSSNPNSPSAIDLTFFKENGYQVFSSVISQDLISAQRDYLKNRVHICLKQLKEELPFFSPENISAYINSPQYKQERSHISSTAKSILAGHFDLETRLSKEIQRILSSPQIIQILELAFPKQKLRMHMPPTARFVLPQNSLAGVPAHQDISYNSHMSDFITIWCPFVPIDDICGGVLVHDKSSKKEQYNALEQKNEVWLKGIPDQGHKKISFKMNPGDVLLLNKWIVHESMPNLSPNIRLSIDYRFFGHHSQSNKHYLELDTKKIIAPSIS